MVMRKAIAQLYSGPDDIQKVVFEYNYERAIIGPSIKVDMAHVITELQLKPDDAALDLEIAIAEDLGLDPRNVKVYKVSFPNVIEVKKLETEKLFI
jgi:hypothetical protein